MSGNSPQPKQSSDQTAVRQAAGAGNTVGTGDSQWDAGSTASLLNLFSWGHPNQTWDDGRCGRKPADRQNPFHAVGTG